MDGQFVHVGGCHVACFAPVEGRSCWPSGGDQWPPSSARLTLTAGVVELHAGRVGLDWAQPLWLRLYHCKVKTVPGCTTKDRGKASMRGWTDVI